MYYIGTFFAIICSYSFLVGNQEFNSPQYIPQKDIGTFSYPKQGYPNINSYYVKQNGRIFQKRVDDLKKLRKATKTSYLVNPDFREIVEMAYWFVKFVGQFGKEYKAHIAQKTEAKLKPDAKDNEVKFSGAFTKNTATMISYMRFFLKFLSSFEKLFKKV